MVTVGIRFIVFAAIHSFVQPENTTADMRLYRVMAHRFVGADCHVVPGA